MLEKRKGFTLIELLAVIIILGILMLIAIPSVTSYISNSRKSTYVSIINQYAVGLQNNVNSLDFPFTDTDTTYYVHINNIKLEKGGKSPFGNWLDAYAIVVFDGKSYDYYWTSVDSAGYKVSLKEVEKIGKEDIIPGSSKTVNNKVTIGGRPKVYIIDKDGNVIGSQGELELTEAEAEKCYTYSLLDGKATITNYDASCGLDVMIPTRIDGYEVTIIGSRAFISKGLTSVLIPNTVVTIESWAFRDNKLTQITIPSSVTTIGDGAFSNNLLTEVSLPSTVKSLGGGAFTNNNFPEESAMIYAQKADGNPDYSKILGYGGTSKSIVIPGEKDGVILKTIGGSAFRSLKLTSVTIPDSVESIEGAAFDGNSLTSIVLPSGLKSIGGMAFTGNKLTSLTIPSSVTTISERAFNNNQLSESDAFIYKRTASGIDYSTIVSYGGSNRSNVVIPAESNGVILKTIGSFAFFANSITNVTIPSSVTSIGTKAFNNNQLSDVQAFIYKRTASGIDYSTLIGYGGKTRANVVIPQTANGVDLKTIDTQTFVESGITSITLPNTVTTIKSQAFHYCSLTSIVIPQSVTTIESNALLKGSSAITLTKIINKTGRSFDWKAITGSVYDASFVAGTIKHQYGNITVVSE